MLKSMESCAEALSLPMSTCLIPFVDSTDENWTAANMAARHRMLKYHKILNSGIVPLSQETSGICLACREKAIGYIAHHRLQFQSVSYS